MTNDIGTSTHNITINDHVDVWAILNELKDHYGVSLGKLLRWILEIGIFVLNGQRGIDVRNIHADYYGPNHWAPREDVAK